MKPILLIIFLWVICVVRVAFGADTLNEFQRGEFKEFGDEYLVFLRAYNQVIYYLDKDPARSRELLPPLYNAAYTLVPKSSRFLGSYYYAKAHIELRAGNQMAASNYFLISIDFLTQGRPESSAKFISALAYEYIDLANVYYSLKMFDKAVPYYKDAVSSFNTLHDNLGMATGLNNLGLVLEKKGALDSALLCFEQGLMVRHKVNNIDTCYYYGHSLKYIGRIKLKKGEFKAAIQILKVAEQLTSNTPYSGAKYILVEIYNLLAQCYIEQGDDKTGLSYFALAMYTAEKYYQNQILCETYNLLAEYNFNKHNYRVADTYADKALALANSKSFFDERLKALMLLMKIATVNGDKLKSIQYLAEFDSLTETQKNLVMESGLATLRESVKNRETIYNKLTENKLLQQRNKTLLFLSLAIVISLLSLASFLFLKYRIKTRAEKELRLAKDDLTRINGVKDRLFSIIAHDLRSPFTALIGYSDVLKTDFDSLGEGEKKSIIQGMNQVSRDTFNLLENLLDWSRIQNDSIICRPEIIQIKDELQSTFNLLQETAKRKEINLIYEIDDKQSIFADRNMLRIIVRNIISNAIKFSPSKSVIVISAIDSENIVTLKITDSGVGISQEVIDKLLTGQSFYTTSGTLGEKGSGLGLMLCTEFIEKNNGHLSIDSKVGFGSTFNLAFPKSTT
ncbi:MAG: tetratricopeptide repeat-containing sensor histidine kinase [Ignavibacteria bacterium]|nr:tetratricopeptide repeat-containing sensor histidine kinase [Ignavibacteria bacterium]